MLKNGWLLFTDVTDIQVESQAKPLYVLKDYLMQNGLTTPTGEAMIVYLSEKEKNSQYKY